MPKTTTIQNYIKVPKDEYLKLKKFQNYFEGFLNYLENVKGIRKAREDIKSKKVFSQEKVFKKLGI